MPSEKTTACRIPPRWFRKNETVMGIIGNTQGVKMAARPSPKAVIRNVGRLPVFAGGGRLCGSVDDLDGCCAGFDFGVSGRDHVRGRGRRLRDRPSL